MHLTFIISCFYVALYEFCGVLSDPLLLNNNTFVLGGGRRQIRKESMCLAANIIGPLLFLGMGYHCVSLFRGALSHIERLILEGGRPLTKEGLSYPRI